MSRSSLCFFALLMMLLPTFHCAWSLPRPSLTKSTLPSSHHRRPFSQLSRMGESLKAANDGDPDSSKLDEDTLAFRPYKWSVGALLVAAFLNLLGFTMAGPITPALGQHFDLTIGASFGSLTSAYPLGMLFGLFLWPSLSDRYGRPPVIVMSLFGTGLGLAGQAYIIAKGMSLELFLLSRIITGCFAGSSPVSKAYLADVCAGARLPKYLAFRDASSTLAYLVGPLLGGIVYSTASTSLQHVIGVSAIASLVAAVIVTIFVKDERPVRNANNDGDNNTKDLFAKNKTTQTLSNDDIVSCPLGVKLWVGVTAVCLVSFLFHVGDSTFHAFFSAMLKEANLEASQIGLAYSFLAGISFTVSATIASRVLKSWGPVLCCASGLSMISVGLVSMGLGHGKLLALISAAALYYCGVPLYSPTIPTMLLRCVPPNRRGFIMGLDGAINTVARIASPLIMGALHQSRGPVVAFGVAGTATTVAALTAVIQRWRVVQQQKQIPMPSKKMG